MTPNDPRHGTTRGYQAHRKAGQKPCPACRDAYNHKRRTQRAHQPRLPYQPLADYIAGRLGRDTVTPWTVAKTLHVDQHNIPRWQTQGLMIATGDRLAVKRLHVHPHSIWGDTIYQDIYSQEVTA